MLPSLLYFRFFLLGNPVSIYKKNGIDSIQIFFTYLLFANMGKVNRLIQRNYNCTLIGAIAFQQYFAI